MATQDYIAVTDIKHGRLDGSNHEIIEFETGEVVDREYFTDKEWNHLIEIGTLVPQAVSKQAEKLEDEVARLQEQLAEANRKLAAANQNQTASVQEEPASGSKPDETSQATTDDKGAASKAAPAKATSK
jgi:hypothetical protein